MTVLASMAIICAKRSPSGIPQAPAKEWAAAHRDIGAVFASIILVSSRIHDYRLRHPVAFGHRRQSLTRRRRSGAVTHRDIGAVFASSAVRLPCPSVVSILPSSVILHRASLCSRAAFILASTTMVSHPQLSSRIHGHRLRSTAVVSPNLSTAQGRYHVQWLSSLSRIRFRTAILYVVIVLSLSIPFPNSPLYVRRATSLIQAAQTLQRRVIIRDSASQSRSLPLSSRSETSSVPVKNLIWPRALRSRRSRSGSFLGSMDATLSTPTTRPVQSLIVDSLNIRSAFDLILTCVFKVLFVITIQGVRGIIIWLPEIPFIR
ncbi:hypothetical protein C8R44DRAFT_892157 [Mycena epipterygia]|nr:hypothetical protein C8R44DRAFT_892157 [Mycena epipterygia]